ncbi:MAG: hypothetical protein ACRD1R_10265 [Acidobacteriota bacterium]
MNESIVGILDNALRYSLWFFVIAFSIILVYVVIRTRRRKKGLIDYLRTEFDTRFEKEIKGEKPEAEKPYIPSAGYWRAAGRSLAATLVLTALFFVVISFTPLSFFANFATNRSWDVTPLRVTSLTYERFYEGFSLEGEVWNQTGEPIEELQAVVRILGEDEELLDEVLLPVTPATLPPGSAGVFTLRYTENSPFLRGYQVHFSGAEEEVIPHVKGFDVQ